MEIFKLISKGFLYDFSIITLTKNKDNENRILNDDLLNINLYSFLLLCLWSLCSNNNLKLIFDKNIKIFSNKNVITYSFYV